MPRRLRVLYLVVTPIAFVASCVGLNPDVQPPPETTDGGPKEASVDATSDVAAPDEGSSDALSGGEASDGPLGDAGDAGDAGDGTSPDAPDYPVSTAISWGVGRLDAFIREPDGNVYHRAMIGSVWAPWESLGGPVAATPIAASWGPGRIDVFAMGTGQNLFTRSWTGSDWYPPAPGWLSLGSLPNGASLLGPVSVVSPAAQRLDLFGHGSSDRSYTTELSGDAQAPWSQLAPEEITGPVQATSWGSDRIDVVGLGSDGNFYWKDWDGSQWLPNWWSIGGANLFPSGTPRSAIPSLVAWGPNRLDVFLVGADAQIYTESWDGTPTGATAGAWTSLGGSFVGQPKAVSWGVNRIDVFGEGSDGAIYTKSFDGIAWAPSWSAIGGGFISAPDAVTWGPGRIDVFAVRADRMLYTTALQWPLDGGAPDAAADEWTNLGGPVSW